MVQLYDIIEKYASDCIQASNFINTKNKRRCQCFKIWRSIYFSIFHFAITCQTILTYTDAMLIKELEWIVQRHERNFNGSSQYSGIIKLRNHCYNCSRCFLRYIALHMLSFLTLNIHGQHHIKNIFEWYLYKKKYFEV